MWLLVNISRDFIYVSFQKPFNFLEARTRTRIMPSTERRCMPSASHTAASWQFADLILYTFHIGESDLDQCRRPFHVSLVHHFSSFTVYNSFLFHAFNGKHWSPSPRNSFPLLNCLSRAQPIPFRLRQPFSIPSY